uniref:transmembrane protein 126A n=1 Tax=Scatophagus argus TaxID=75038 RepID=UPI001ED7CFBC|nr:transmembrane protein 126A [Scatophagus argus]
MSENMQKDSFSGKPITRPMIFEMFEKNFQRLPSTEQKLFIQGPMYLAGIASIAGVISNNMYRRALNVTQASIASSLPMAVVPFVATFGLYNAAVTNPLMHGDLECPTCATIRGAVTGVIGGGLYPILLALPMNAALASRYQTAPMPEKGNVLRTFVDLSRPILRKMSALVFLQAILGTYLSSKNFESYIKVVQMTFGSSGEQSQD